LYRQLQNRLAVHIDALRKTHGDGIILRGHDFRLRQPPADPLVKPEGSPSKIVIRVPWSFGSSWEPTGFEVPLLTKIMQNSIECRDLPLNEEPYKTALETAQFLDGMPRYPKMHPCGVVLSRQPMRELTPICRAIFPIPLQVIMGLVRGGQSPVRVMGMVLSKERIPWTLLEIMRAEKP
jgi:hypothetical protein